MRKMNELAEKARILDEAGYKYVLDRSIYFNRRTRKIFSVEFIEDTSADKLQQLVNGHANGGDWSFHFNTPPSASVKRELESILG
jgi:hypothetical protein